MAKKIILIVIMALVMATGLPGCRELPLIGDLAGQWQITKMTAADGTDMTVPERYYCFYRHTAQLTAPGAVKHTANMTYDNPELTLEFPENSPLDLVGWGIIPPDDATAYEKGWVVRYHIDRLDNGHLVMTTDQGVSITLRKY